MFRPKIALLTLVFVCLTISMPVYAQDGGNTGFDFLRTDIGGRPSAMGGAFTAVRGDLLGLWHNPASLWSVPDYSVTLTYLDHLMDIRSGFLAISKDLGKAGQIAAGLFYMNYGQLRRTDVTGQDLGSFSPGDLIFSLTWANHIRAGLFGGVTAKAFFSRIDEYSAGGIAADIGFLYFIESQDLTIGLSMLNAGAALDTYHDEKEKLPLSYRFGISKQLAHLPLSLNAGIIRYHHHKSSIAGGVYWMLGGEFTITENFLLRWGYNSRGSEQKTGASNDWLAGFSLGLGFRLLKFELDYGFCAWGALGYTHHFTFTMPLK